MAAAERQEYNEQTPWWGEHIHRYHASIPYVKENHTILDIACGNGFGSFFLSKHTPSGKIIGGDLSQEAVTSCISTFRSDKNIEFKVMDATAIKMEDNSLDIIVSFETIEHTTEYKAMLKELRRVLKKSGYLILSTPNIIVNSPDGIVRNPFHTQEFNYNEILALLKGNFEEVRLMGQKYIRYQNSSVRNSIGRFIETILYMRGIRKLPLPIQDAIMKAIIKKPMYPLANDYAMVEAYDEVIKCKTFFALCKKL